MNDKGNKRKYDFPNSDMLPGNPSITKASVIEAVAADPKTDQGEAEERAKKQARITLERKNSVSNLGKNNPFLGPDKDNKFFQDMREKNTILVKNNRLNIQNDDLSSSAPKVDFNTVTTDYFEVGHYNPFRPTREPELSRYNKFLARANRVCQCLSDIIKYMNTNVPKDITKESPKKQNEIVISVIKAAIEKNKNEKPYLWLKEQMSTNIGENACNATLSGPNLDDLDDFYYEYQDATEIQEAVKVTFLDYAINCAIENYQSASWFTIFIRNMFSIKEIIKRFLRLNGGKTRRNKRSKKSKKCKKSKNSKRTKRINHSRRN